MKITANFTLEELCHTSCGYTNNPNTWQIINLCFGANNILQPLRDYIGKPITINSGFRSIQVNKIVGGVKNSQHIAGCAADIRVSKYDMEKVMSWLENCKFCDQVLQGVSFIHVSWVISNPRRQVIYNYYNY